MDVLPHELQAHVYEVALELHGNNPRPFAHVSAVSCLAREAATRTAVLSNRQELHRPYDANVDSPLPMPTWRVRRMAASVQAAELQRMAQRFSQLRHISVDLNDSGGGGPAMDRGEVALADATAGLRMFMHHMAPSLMHATRLTVRGPRQQPGQEPPLQYWRSMVGSPLAAACTHLDFITDAASASMLLHGLAHYFPAVQSAHVRVHQAITADEFKLSTSIRAPDCLTHLQIIHGSLVDGQRPTDVYISSARGLQVLVLGLVPQGSQAERECLVKLCAYAAQHAPALHTIQGFPELHLSFALPELKILEATIDVWTEAAVREWLFELHVWAPKLQQVCVWVKRPTLSPVQVRELLAWADALNPFNLSLTAMPTP